MPIKDRTEQPALRILRERHLSVPAVAYALDIPQKESWRVRNVLYGSVYPTAEIMHGISKFLDLPVEELFDEQCRQRVFGTATATAP